MPTSITTAPGFDHVGSQHVAFADCGHDHVGLQCLCAFRSLVALWQMVTVAFWPPAASAPWKPHDVAAADDHGVFALRAWPMLSSIFMQP